MSAIAPESSLGFTNSPKKFCKDAAKARKMREVYNESLGKVRYVHTERENVTQMTVYSKNITIFVPGIREKKTRKDEHKRSLDPLSAIKKGATYIIIGRPITKSKNPKETLKLINQEIENYLEKN